MQNGKIVKIHYLGYPELALNNFYNQKIIMELSGKIIALLPLQTGTGKNGTWKKQEYVIETTDKIARKVCFSLWGDKIDQYGLKAGDDAEVSFDLESREYNGRWYTEVKAWKVARKSSGSPASSIDEMPPDLTEYQGGNEEVPF
jgi:hypothetical protein